MFNHEELRSKPSIFAFCCQNQDSRLIYCNTTWQTWQCVDPYKVSQIWIQIYRNQKILNNQNTKYNNHALNLGCFFKGCCLGCIVWRCRTGDCAQLEKKCNMGVTRITPMLHPFYQLCPSPPLSLCTPNGWFCFFHTILLTIVLMLSITLGWSCSNFGIKQVEHVA